MFPQRYDISDRAELSVIKTDKFKSSVISFSLTLPATAESATYSTILSGLMRRGSKSLPSMSELNRALDELYGSYLEIKSYRSGDNSTFTIAAEFLDNKYIPDGTDVAGGVIDIAADLLLSPALLSPDFSSKAFEQECRVVTDRLNSIKNSTRSYATTRCSELLNRESDTCVTIEQAKQMVAEATLARLLEYYNKLITKALVKVFYIGSLEPDLLLKKLRSALGSLPAASAPERCPLAPHKSAEYCSRRESMPVKQGKLSMGFNLGVALSATDTSYYTALVLNELFGGSAASKLFLNVRERLSLCYYCSSSYSLYSGIMLVSSGIEVSNYDRAREAILAELNNIKQGRISEAELAAAKKSLKNSYRQLYDNPFDLQSFWSGRALFAIGDGIEDCISHFESVSSKDIEALARGITLDAEFFVEGTAAEGEEEDWDE